MFKKRLTDATIPTRPTWRKYQADLNKSTARKLFHRGTFKLAAVFVILLTGVYGILGGLGGAACHHKSTSGPTGSEAGGNTPDRPRKMLDKNQVQFILESETFVNLKQNDFNLVHEENRLHVETSLDMTLQHFLLEQLNPSTSRYIGIVAMEPSTGRVLAMVGFDKLDSSGNPCVDGNFPAASVFKIVTAAAAIEKHNFNSDTPMTYNGKKHTLYKSQLKERQNKWTRKTTLRKSFAKSVNPVFGKIGVLVLGKPPLEEYARAFGFNHKIAFEISVGPSFVALSDDPYQWAEVASGFNRKTRISPLHGAMIASAILNQGQLIEPTIVDRMSDENGRIVYRGRPKVIRKAMRPEGTRVMNQIMAETVKTGTGRKVFHGYKQDKILSKLNIGGKTGSISNASHDIRYDWFVGFAEEKTGPEKIVLSIVVAHEEYIGIRAGQYARMAMKQYFKNYFAEIEKQRTEG